MSDTDELITITPTSLALFAECRYKWDYVVNLGLSPKIPNRHSVLGTAIHAGLAEHYRGRGLDETYYAYTESWVNQGVITGKSPISGLPEDLQDYYRLGNEMLGHYVEWAQERDGDFSPIKNTIETKLDMNLIAPGDLGFRVEGKLDMIVEHEGKLWVVEHKTFTSTQDIIAALLAPQGIIYVMLAENAGYANLRGVCYNILKKSHPEEPKILKNGQMSRDKSVKCSPEHYRHALDRAGLDQAPYEDFIASLPPDKYFSRLYIPVSYERKLDMLTQLGDVAIEMSRGGMYQPTSWNKCTYCDYKALCVARFSGQAFADMAAREFVQKGGSVAAEETD